MSKTKHNIDFNMKTLDHYKNDPDEDIRDLATTCVDDFKKYAGIVLRFDDKMQAVKQEKSGQEYREYASKLDKQRRMIHNNCLNDIEIINRLANNDHLPPFVSYDGDKNALNRTDYGNAILKQCYEEIRNNEERVVPETKTEHTRDEMDNYNNMLPFNKYPVVKDGKNYKFIEIFTQKETPYKQVEHYIKGRTDDPDKLNYLKEAKSLVDLSKPQKTTDKDVANSFDIDPN